MSPFWQGFEKRASSAAAADEPPADKKPGRGPAVAAGVGGALVGGVAGRLAGGTLANHAHKKFFGKDYGRINNLRSKILTHHIARTDDTVSKREQAESAAHAKRTPAYELPPDQMKARLKELNDERQQARGVLSAKSNRQHKNWSGRNTRATQATERLNQKMLKVRSAVNHGATGLGALALGTGAYALTRAIQKRRAAKAEEAGAEKQAVESALLATDGGAGVKEVDPGLEENGANPSSAGPLTRGFKKRADEIASSGNYNNVIHPGNFADEDEKPTVISGDVDVRDAIARRTVLAPNGEGAALR